MSCSIKVTTADAAGASATGRRPWGKLLRSRCANKVMMAKKREERYASTADRLSDLKSVAASEPPL